MIKIYKNNGFLYINDNNNIELNTIIIKNYNKYKDKMDIKEILVFSKKEYYIKYKRCNYELT